MSDNPYQYLDMSWRSALLLCLICPIIVTALTLAFRQVEKVASIYLALFLVVFCLNVVPQVIGFSGFYQAFPGLTFAPFNNELWLGPLLLLHTLAITKRSIPKWLLGLCVLAAMQTLYYFTAFIGIDTYQEKWAYNDAIHVVYILPIETLLTIIVSYTCVIKAYTSVRQYKKELLDLQSDEETYDISWLTWLVGLVGTLVILWLCFEILHFTMPSLSYIDQYPFHVAFLFIVLLLSQHALSSIRLPFPKPVARELAISSQQDFQQSKLVDLIHKGMTTNQWYLNPQYSLSDMARALNTNETYLSRAINNGLNKTFNSLVNEARVEHAKQILVNQPNTKLIDLMYESGFNSKASFNRWFKVVTKKTPSQFQSSIN